MTTHPAKQQGASQCTIILARLQAEFGEWVSMPILGRSSRSYNVHSRISDLRNRGHKIEHVNIQEHRKVKSFYRLIA
jgi:hypothetical protein